MEKSALKRTLDHDAPPTVADTLDDLSNIHHSKIQRMMSTYPSDVASAQARLFGGGGEPLEYQKTVVTETSERTPEDTFKACRSLHQCRQLRNKWMNGHKSPLPEEFVMRDSVVSTYLGDGVMNQKCPLVYNVFNRKNLSDDTCMYKYVMSRGVVQVLNSVTNEIVCSPLSFEDFVEDYNIVSFFSQFTMIHQLI